MSTAIENTDEIRMARLREILDSGALRSAGKLLKSLTPAELANFIESLPPTQREILWSINIKTAIDALEGDIARHIIDNEDPPDKVVYEGNTYYLEEDDIGEYFKGNSKEGLKFVVWDFIDNKQEKQLSTEQWGETKFDVTLGQEVEEYQFSNILPGEG